MRIDRIKTKILSSTLIIIIFAYQSGCRLSSQPGNTTANTSDSRQIQNSVPKNGREGSTDHSSQAGTARATKPTSVSPRYSETPAAVPSKTQNLPSSRLVTGAPGPTVSPTDECIPDQERPCFSDLLANFPISRDPTEVYEEIGGVVSQNHERNPSIRNWCALGISKSLNYSGYEIPFIEGETGSGDDGKWYFYRVLALNDYLRDKFGDPDLIFDLPDGMGELAGKRGIIYFRACNWGDAYGHIDLFDGTTCADHCYSNRCVNAHFWEMP